MILFGIIWKLALSAFNETLEKRQAAIKGEQEAAVAEHAEASGILEQYKSDMANARDEAGRIVEEARQAGESVKADIIAKAETEAEAIKARARDEAAGERERVQSAMHREVATLSLDIAEKVVGASLDRSASQSLVDEFIASLDGAQA